MMNRIYWMLRTWYWRSRAAESYRAALNRRVDVENVLAQVAMGKRDLLTREECRDLARKLAGS